MASGWVDGGTESRADEGCSNLKVGDMTGTRTIMETQMGSERNCFDLRVMPEYLPSSYRVREAWQSLMVVSIDAI
jgi:hypothetical protein